MKRTKSSLLAFKLREVRTAAAAALPYIARRVHPLSRDARASRRFLLSCSPFRPRHNSIADHAHTSRLSSSSQFLDSKDETATEFMPMQRVHEHSRQPLMPNRLPPSQQQMQAASNRADPDKVWVDAYFYGFYIDKARLPAFQRSLQQQLGHAAGRNPVGVS